MINLLSQKAYQITMNNITLSDLEKFKESGIYEMKLQESVKMIDFLTKVLVDIE